jgi:hypothetical protein
MSMIWQRLRAWAKGMNADILALWIAARDSRTPAVAKLIAAIVAAYALSPIDLIPDFIPVRLIPPPLMEEYRAEAQRRSARPSSRAGAAFVVLLWLAAAAAMWLWFEPKT